MDEGIIETGVAATLRIVINQVVAGAGLALLRGPVGIGKSYSLNLIARELAAEGVIVVRLTATEVTGGSISAFIHALLAQYRIEVSSTWEGVEALWDQLLSGDSFQDFGQRVILVVDEAQVLKPSILETIRGLWDRGDQARLSMKSGRAFGCALVGNDTFLGKGGKMRTASYKPLLSRVTHDIGLPIPSRDEHIAFARVLFPDQPELQETIADFGLDAGNFRAQDVAARQARLNAGGDAVALDHLRLAIKFMGGK